MENKIANEIQKVKAITVNDFTFENEKDETILERGKVTVKVLNTVREIFVSDESRSRYVEKEKLIDGLYRVHDNNFSEQLKELNIEADYSEVCELYGDALKVIREKNREINRKKKEENWKKSFAPQITINNARREDLLVSVKPDNYLNDDSIKYHSRIYLSVTYKGQHTDIKFTKVGKDKWGNGGNYKFQFYFDRYYTHQDAQKAIEKFITLVNDKIIESSRKKNEEESIEEKKDSTINHLKETFGIEITAEKVYRKVYGKRYSSYTTAFYYIYKANIGKNIVSISIVDNDTYSLSEFRCISADQVKKIIELMK